MIIAAADSDEARIEQSMSSRIVIRKLLRIIGPTNPPWKAEVQTRPQPVQFVRHITVRTVFGRKQVAVWRERKVKRVTRALCENVARASQRIGVVREEKIRPVRRYCPARPLQFAQKFCFHRPCSNFPPDK